MEQRSEAKEYDLGRLARYFDREIPKNWGVVKSAEDVLPMLEKQAAMLKEVGSLLLEGNFQVIDELITSRRKKN